MKMNRIMKMIAIAAMTLLQPLLADAQEKIIEVHNLQDVSSIVRETKDGLWLVCNNSYAKSRFTLVDETQTTAPQLELGYITGTDSTYINDFEIFRDTVYFCGQTWREKESIAIWGYFPLAGFPSVNISYTEMGCNYLSKLDVFSIDTTTFDLHVVMVGHYSDNYLQLAYLYDIVRTAPNVFTSFPEVLFPTGGTAILQDVAVTDNQVAVAVAGTLKRILFIDRPATIATTFLNGVGYYYEWFTGGFYQDMVLEHCVNDALVLVYKGYSSNMLVHSFISGTPHVHIEINNTGNWRPVDLKFEKATGNLDVLANGNINSPRAFSSQIFHLNQSLAYNGGPIFCHKYLDEKLESLDWLKSQPKGYVASGHDSSQQILRLYKYFYDDWSHCSVWETEKTLKLDVLEDTKDITLTSSGRELEMKELRAFDLENPLRVICE